MKVAVVGGGPGGLFAATLICRADPSAAVTLFERNRADDTFGFGVVFSDATLAGIDAVDPVLRTALRDHGVHWDPIEVRVHGERLRCAGNGMAAVGRKALLALLQQGAVDAGVDVRFSTSVELDTLIEDGFDVVVAADGANSAIRQRFADVFEPTVETAAAKFIWLGTPYPFEGLTFVHQRGDHGVFAVHGYPIGDGVSTFIVETDEVSWRAAGLDAFDTTQPPGPSDENTRDYLADLFADQIDGHPLLVNNSRWSNFRTHRARRWSHTIGGTHVALVGDAAHTAHFSVGSGTKMAMEDAIALADALGRHRHDVAAALADYEQIRQPSVAKIQGSARPSLSWWEHFGRSYDHLPPWQFAYHFFTRSLPESKLRRRDPGFVDAIHQDWTRAHGTEPLETTLRIGDRQVPGRVVPVGDDAVRFPDGDLPLHPEPPSGGPPWGLSVAAPGTEAGMVDALQAVAAGVAAGACLVAVRGGTSMTRRLLCESSRLDHGTPSLLIDDAGASAYDAAVTAVLSGRADLVAAGPVAADPDADPATPVAARPEPGQD